ncbi:MAG TPA: PAS domain S-box protein [Bryobacteraceae bacterium]|jgi:PAS domain S-box-containing protein
MEDIRCLLDALGASAVGVTVTDAAGRFLLANQAYTRITGYTEEELKTRTYQSITHPDDLPIHDGLARRLSAGEIDNCVYEQRYIRKDGQTLWVRNSVSMMRTSDGQPANGVTLTEDITDRKRAEEAMEAANRQLRQLSTDLLRSQDTERRRIARELHDGTGQLLAGLRMNLSRLLDLHPLGSPGRGLVEDAADLTAECVREIRTLSYLLHPPMIDELGLAGALQSYVEGFRQRTGIEVALRIAASSDRLPPDVEITIFRIVQEALANIHRHSESPLAIISLERKAHQVRLEVADRGRGMAARAAARGGGLGVGIPGMRERAELLGGWLEIVSDSGGASISVTLPINEHYDEDTHSPG